MTEALKPCRCINLACAAAESFTVSSLKPLLACEVVSLETVETVFATEAVCPTFDTLLSAPESAIDDIVAPSGNRNRLRLKPHACTFDGGLLLCPKSVNGFHLSPVSARKGET
jgi:hypothetical protein